MVQKGFRFRGFLVFILVWNLLFSLYAGVTGRPDLILPILCVGLPLGIAVALLLLYSGLIPWMKKRRITMNIPYYILIFSIVFMVSIGQFILALPLVLVLAVVIVMQAKGLITCGGPAAPPQP